MTAKGRISAGCPDMAEGAEPMTLLPIVTRDFQEGRLMFKKFAFIAIAAAISSAAVISSSAPVAAQGISVQLGNGGGGYRGHRDGYRGDGYRRGRPEYVRR